MRFVRRHLRTYLLLELAALLGGGAAFVAGVPLWASDGAVATAAFVVVLVARRRRVRRSAA